MQRALSSPQDGLASGEAGGSGLIADACGLSNPARELDPSACRRRSVSDDGTQSIECGARPIFVRRVYRLVSTRDGCANGVRDSLAQCGATLFSSALQGSARSVGYWGAVRVLPEADVGSELECEGRILHSHAAELRLRLICRDATGAVWLDKTSFQRAGEKDYLDEQMAVQDPFRPLFYELANELAAALSNRFAESAELIRATALMRYGIALAPDTFRAFVRPVDDRFELVGCQRKATPCVSVSRASERASILFVDAVDEAYNEVLINMVGPYRIWRQYQYEFETYNQLLGADDRVGRQQLAFDYDALLGAYRRYQDYRRNQDELEEMADSLNRSLAPTLAEVEGRVLELSGNMAGHYRMWRSLLRQLYQEEGRE